ncbi:hypothetical protein AHMF7616_00060 [Adhaeribacter pallidiroseus]|uniref:Uncharacterized protein n=1 Tax=Adhaeribacter pallidiroseus TaxID=2072847 RepID=A0A369Q9C5_9BACT|nr:hypothetical protein AHMF7616_00060 [Adhaeribacter pallidiroseus]
MTGTESLPAFQARVPEQIVLRAVRAHLSRFVFYSSRKVSNGKSQKLELYANSTGLYAKKERLYANEELQKIKIFKKFFFVVAAQRHFVLTNHDKAIVKGFEVLQINGKGPVHPD